MFLLEWIGREEEEKTRERGRVRRLSVKNTVLTGVMMDVVGVGSSGGELVLGACGMVTKTNGGAQDGPYRL